MGSMLTQKGNVLCLRLVPGSRKPDDVVQAFTPALQQLVAVLNERVKRKQPAVTLLVDLREATPLTRHMARVEADVRKRNEQAFREGVTSSVIIVPSLAARAVIRLALTFTKSWNPVHLVKNKSSAMEKLPPVKLPHEDAVVLWSCPTAGTGEMGKG